MPIKIFAAPGDHRDDFEKVTEQFNAWEAENKPAICEIHTSVDKLITQREIGSFMLTIVARYQPTADA